MELFIKWSRNSSQCQNFWSEIGQLLERPTRKVQLQRRAPPLIYDLDKEDDSSYVQYTSMMMMMMKSKTVDVTKKGIKAWAYKKSPILNVVIPHTAWNC